MSLWLLGLGREVGQSTGKVLRVVKVMDEVGMGALLQNPDTAQTWGTHWEQLRTCTGTLQR